MIFDKITRFSDKSDVKDLAMNSMNHDCTGKILGAKRYRLERRINQSKMSAVYQATDLILKRLVVVKVMNGTFENETLLRFQREAHVMAQLDHANIIPIYDYGEQESLVFLVMPYLPQGSLQDVLVRRGALSVEEAYRYIKQAAIALDYSHSLNVIHRDLKPPNFLLHTDGRLMLTDFGIARIKSSHGHSDWTTLTDQRTFIGTPGYIAPETIRGEPVDHRADIYALGIVLHQMLSGDIPFKGDTYAILIQQLQGNLPILHLLNPAIPKGVDTVILRATAQEPEKRFKSAGTFAQALRQAMKPDVISASNPPSINPRHTSEVRVDENFLRIARAPTIFKERATSAIPTVTHILPMAQHVKETQPTLMGVRSYRTKIVITLITLLVICGLLASFISTSMLREPAPIIMVPPPVSTFTSTPSPVQQSIDEVKHYYDTWNKRNYTGAYNQLGSVYQKMHPYSTLLSSYENTFHSLIRIDGTEQIIPEGEFKVTITDFAIEKSLTGTQRVNRIYRGYFIVAKENGVWKLTPYFQY
jgi:serine/threonine protein kinase